MVDFGDHWLPNFLILKETYKLFLRELETLSAVSPLRKGARSHLSLITVCQSPREVNSE